MKQWCRDPQITSCALSSVSFYAGRMQLLSAADSERERRGHQSRAALLAAQAKLGAKLAAMAAARPCKLLPAIAAAAQATNWGGLRNQGNTCYLNSLLQTLFHVPALRGVLGRPGPRGVLRRCGRRRDRRAPWRTSSKAGTERDGADARPHARARRGGLQQQDAQEYLRLLVGELEDAALGDRVRAATRAARRTLEATDAEAGGTAATGQNSRGGWTCRWTWRRRTAPWRALSATSNPKFRRREPVGVAGRALRRAQGVRFARLPPAIVLHLKRFAYDYTRDEVRKVGALRVPFRLPRRPSSAPRREAADAEEGDEAVAGRRRRSAGRRPGPACPRRRRPVGRAAATTTARRRARRPLGQVRRRPRLRRRRARRRRGGGRRRAGGETRWGPTSSR